MTQIDRIAPIRPAGATSRRFLLQVLAAVARAAGRPAEVVADETSRTARAFFGIAAP